VSSRPLVKGVLTLSTASLLVRVMGFIYRVLLVRTAGPEVVGVFQMTSPLLRLSSALVSLGLPIALSKTVAESLTKRDTARIRRSFKASFTVVLANSLIATAIILLGARVLSERILPDSRTRLAVMTIPLSLVFMSTSGILRGYFHGYRNATPPATAQVMEQLVRIAVTASLTTRIANAPVESAAAVIMLALGVGEMAGFATLIAFRIAQGRSESHSRATVEIRPRDTRQSSFTIVSELLSVSLPLTAVGFVSSISSTVDAMVIPRRLLIAGCDSSEAAVLFGRLSGMAMPVVFLPGLIVFPIATMLLPEVAASAASGDTSVLKRRLKQVLLWTSGLTVAMSLAMPVAARPISMILYGTDEAVKLIAWYAPAVPFLYIGYVLGSALNGLGKTKVVLISTVAGTLLHFAVLCYTVAIPSINVYGVIIGDTCGFGLSAAINCAALLAYTRRLATKRT
jgi:stage V sporulation protein B